MRKHIPEDQWEYIVEHMPIPSVDLIVYDPNATSFLLGRRTNAVAEDTWFVPGGRIYKNERYRDAADRLLKEETGLEGTIDESLGSYEHFYDTADANGVQSKHYTPTAFVVIADSETPLSPDAQHSELRWFSDPPDGIHEYSERYLEDAGLMCSSHT